MLECTKNLHGRIIYVDCESGNDKYPGTKRKPLKSISEVNKRVHGKISGLFFASGEEFDGTLTVEGVNGPNSSAFVIGTYNNGTAVIRGGDGESIHIENSGNICVENLHLKGNGRKGGNTTNGLKMINCHDCSIKAVFAEGFQKSGVDLYNCKYIKVLDVKATDNGFCGINVQGSEREKSGSILIKDCRAENNPGDPANLDNHSGNGILAGVSDSIVIDHCTATNNGWDMPRQGNGPVGIWTWESNHVVIQYCISYRNKTSRGGKDGGGFDLDGGVTNSIIQYCLSYENQGAGYGLFQYSGASAWSKNTIRYCISINDAQVTEGAGSLFIWNGSGESKQLCSCNIYNNVIYNSLAPVISFENSSEHEDFFFFNNIFIGAGNLIGGRNTGSLFAGNSWDGGEHPASESGNNPVPESGRINSLKFLLQQFPDYDGDPGLTGPFCTEITNPYQLTQFMGFIPRSNSLLKDRGLDFNKIPGMEKPLYDFYGHHVPMGKAPEPGICELE
jgi:hypothetical protein